MLLQASVFSKTAQKLKVRADEFYWPTIISRLSQSDRQCQSDHGTAGRPNKFVCGSNRRSKEAPSSSEAQTGHEQPKRKIHILISPMHIETLENE